MVESLESSMQQISSSTKNNMSYIILRDEFNLPDINWDNNTMKTNPQYGNQMNSKLVEIATENDLTQIVSEPTRGNNILDLMFTNDP
jgi:hypothetical protein